MNNSFDDSGAVTDGRLKHIVLVGGDDQYFRSFLGLNAEFTVIQIAGAVGSNQRQAAHRIYEVDDFDYPLGKVIEKASDGFDYIAVGFDSMSTFVAMFETFDHMVSRAESGHPHTQLSLH